MSEWKVVAIQPSKQVHVKSWDAVLMKEDFTGCTGILRGMAWENNIGVLKVDHSCKFYSTTVQSFNGAKRVLLSENSIEDHADTGPAGLKVVLRC